MSDRITLIAVNISIFANYISKPNFYTWLAFIAQTSPIFRASHSKAKAVQWWFYLTRTIWKWSWSWKLLSRSFNIVSQLFRVSPHGPLFAGVNLSCPDTVLCRPEQFLLRKVLPQSSQDLGSSRDWQTLLKQKSLHIKVHRWFTRSSYPLFHWSINMVS